jgi:lipopolysaccharide/colanic/teichoic acid biosynthesis glycosyltransferase
MERRGLPRSIEVAAALVALLAALPFLVVIAVLVRLADGGPALFAAERVGRGGRRFRLWKLRSMTAGSRGPGVTAAGDPRVTRLGRWLRRSKLDELPSLWNVVRGDLGLVGPRPELPGYVDLGDPRWRRLLAVRPGLADPVTVRLRDEEELLARAAGSGAGVGGGVGNADELYRRFLLPWKIAGSLDYLERRTARGDVAVIAAAIRAIVLPGRCPPPRWDEITGLPAGPAESVEQRA